MPTREQIIADAEKFPEPARSVEIAYGEFLSGLVVEQHCPYCETLIRVQALSETAWKSECDCGRCNCTCRGL